MNVEEKFELLIQEIETVSKLAREYFDSEDFDNDQKSDGSVVTKIDTEIERHLRNFINEYFPDDAVVGEEDDNKDGISGFVWHIDPIDGTDNFLRKIPFCAISVARLGDSAEGSFGIVHNPITNHTFASFKEEGAYENKNLIKTTAEPMGGRYFISVDRGREPWMKLVAQKLSAALANEFGKATPYGSTALNLAYVASGRFDAVITFGLSTYDYGAGLYLVKAAGGAISVLVNGEWQLWEGSIKDLCDCHGKTIFVSHPEVHEQMRDFIGDLQKWAD